MYRISALAATSSIHPALYAIPVRTVGISPRTSSSTVRYLPAVVLQVWDSASSRLRADFHRSAHIASVVQRRSPPSVSLAGFVDPGSYLLSRDLSSDYHRRADVSLPGSEWNRVGPSGYDHQASGSVFLSVCPVGRAARCCLLDAQAG